MSKISKYIKLDKNILLEYIYNDGNLLSESYEILVNSKSKSLSYIASDSSLTTNIKENQLFKLDTISNRYGKVDTNIPFVSPPTPYYTFLQEKNYPSGNPVRHDTIKVHLPVNWTFGEYIGFYIRVYAFDSYNDKTYELSNFYFDMTDVNQTSLLNFSSPPLLFQEKLWGKNVVIEIPALSEVSTQLTNSTPRENSINYNLTNGDGLSMTSPVFIDFHFIENIQTINNITSYLLAPNVTTTLPQTPEFEKLGLVIQHSSNGDFFEIFGTYNDTLGGFGKFIEDSFTIGRDYYVQYDITIYEQNIRGKTTTITETDVFNEAIEYRPIIKYSTSTAIIDVEMRLIDNVDDSYIIRRASYGLLQDELSKYSLNMMKINVKGVAKPKIYNLKNTISSIGVNNLNGTLVLGGGKSNVNSFGTGAVNPSVTVETVKVPYPVLIDRFNIMAKSDNAVLDNKTFYGLGKIQILLYPFDNVVKFSVATGTNNKPEYLNMSGISEIKLVIKNEKSVFEFPLFIESGEVNLSIGQIIFKIGQAKMNEIKKIWDSGINVFYIVGTSQSTTSVIYTGLFKIWDNKTNISGLTAQVEAQQLNSNNPGIILDPNIETKETAVVTRKLVNEQAPNKKL